MSNSLANIQIFNSAVMLGAAADLVETVQQYDCLSQSEDELVAFKKLADILRAHADTSMDFWLSQDVDDV